MKKTSKKQKKRKEPTANRAYKNSVFTLLFGEKAAQLYEAITGKPLPPGTKIAIATLTDVLFRGVQNDLAFIIDDKLVIIIEHQSTINPNMPLRILGYYEKTSGNYIIQKYGEHAIYGKKMLKIPYPEFIVLYNGEKELPGGADRYTMRLSDMFADASDLTDGNRLGGIELEVKVFNINKGRNPEMAARCADLYGYETFIQMIRDNEKSGKPREEAVRTAVFGCIEQNILKEFLTTYKTEVINMLVQEWDFEVEKRVAWEEGMEEGMEKGREEGRDGLVRTMLAKGVSYEKIIEYTGLSVDDLIQIEKSEAK